MTKLHARTIAHRVGAVLVGASAALSIGCAARVYSEPTPTYAQPAYVAQPQPYDDSAIVYVDQPPVVDIEAYPSVAFEGGNAYFVDGRWYRRGPRGWGYYRQEPPELYRQRGYVERQRGYVQQAPPAYRHDERGYAQPAPEAVPVPQRRGVTEPQPVPPGPRPRGQVRRGAPPPTERAPEHR